MRVIQKVLISLFFLVFLGNGLASNNNDSSVVDAINKSLRQEVERTAKSVETSQPKEAAPKPVVLLPNDWLKKISQSYTLPQDANQTLPRQRIEWYLLHKHVLQQQLLHSRSAIYSMFEQLQSQGLPTELALIPLLTQGGSVQLNAASLAVLKRLQPTMKDPLLLIAVYVSSEAAVNELVKAHPDQNFWAMPWPSSTLLTVANLVALAQLVKYADAYGLGVVTPNDVPAKFVPGEFKAAPSAEPPSLEQLIEKIFSS